MIRPISFPCFAITLSLFTHQTYGAEDYAHCRPIITDSLKEIDIEIDSAEYLNTVFDKHCEKDGAAKESSLNVGIDAVVDALPVKFKLGTSDKKQSIRDFCKQYKVFTSDKRGTFRRRERIVARAYDSYDTCIQLASQGIKLSHKVRTLDSLDFFVAPAIGKPVTLNGVKASENIRCVGRDSGSIFGNVAQLNVDSRIVVKDAPLNIVCTRNGRNDKNEGNVYEEGFVILLTDLQPYGNYGVVLPRDAKLPENQASALKTQFDNQREAITELQKTVGVISSPVTASPELTFSASRGGGQSPLSMISMCPPDQMVVGVEIVVGGTCQQQCNADGGALHKFRVRCAPRFNTAKK